MPAVTLINSEDKDLTYARESGSVQTYTIEFGATPTVKLQICVNCIIPNQYGGGHSTMRYKPLTIVDNKASFTVSKEDCSYTGLSYKKVVEGEKEKWIQDQEYTDEPQDVTSIVLQACEKDATYPATINIKSIKRVTTTGYTLELADHDFTKGDKAIGGWNGIDTNDFKSVILKDDDVYVDVITFTPQKEPHNVQVDFENVYPKGAKIQLTMVARGDVEGSIKAGLQNPNGYKGCGDFEDINLTTAYQTFTRTVTCSGDNARRLLLNVGTYGGTIYIKSVNIVALDVPEETVTISPSGYSTYAAYYPVDYSKINGLKAYKVTLKGDKTGIEMKEVKAVVPAGVAVLLKGTANTPYALLKYEGWSWGEPSGLKMSDGNATSTDAATLYALATKDGVTAFYPVKKDSPIPAKRCYLEVNGTSQNAAFYSLGTNFGETTGISSVENKVEKADAPVYNLAGQLVGKDYKGLVIKNGKKFVIK